MHRHSISAGMALLLTACSPARQPMPNLESRDQIARALARLSPWEDGSPDRSNDKRTPGEENSDRQVFGRWVMRNAIHEAYDQHDRDYVPIPVPWTVGQAIRDQRDYEARMAVLRERREAKESAEQARVEAARQAEHARQAAEKAATAKAKQEADLAEREARAERERARTECRRQKEEAGNAAHNAAGGIDGGVAYRAAAAAFHCD